MVSIPIIYAIRFLLVESYAYVCHTKGMETYATGLSKFSRSMASESDMDMSRTFDRFLCSQYCEAAATNFEENNVKHATFINALRFLIIAALAGLIQALPYFALKAEGRAHARVIENVNLLRR